MNAMHPNSIEAFNTTEDLRSERSYMVLAVYRNCNKPLTDRECMRELGYTDPNKVRPRITELVDLGMLKECGKAYDPESFRNVRTVRYVEQEIHNQLRMKI